MSEESLVSVVMPAYNGVRFLNQAIDSIREQTFKEFDFIIVDDGSKDATAEMLGHYASEDTRIQIVTHRENRGYIEALNSGFAVARGKYIARMDQDDVAKPYRLEMQLNFLAAHPGIALVGAAVELIDADSRVFKTISLPSQPEELRRDLRGYGNAIAHPTVFFRRSVLQEVGGFRKAYRAAEDYDLWLRIMEKFDVANLQTVLLGYRRHEGSISYKNARQQALSCLCARTTAKLRLQGSPDPTSGIDCVTEGVLRDLGVTQEAIDAAIFKNMLELAEDATRSGFSSAAAEFTTMARRYAPPDKLARTSLELNRTALHSTTAAAEQKKHRVTLVTADPSIYWKIFGPSTTKCEGFSVLIPVYNHANYVRQAVASALRSPLVHEVILLDDGSADGSAEILAELSRRNPTRVRDLTKKSEGNRGAHNRLNELVQAATSSWVAVLNSDDIFVDSRFEAILGDPSFPRSDFVYGNLLIIDEAGRLVSAKRGPFDPFRHFPQGFDVEKMAEGGDLLDLLAHQNFLGTTSNMIFTRALHTRIGGFRAFRYVHDWDFALRAMVLGRCCYVRRYITSYRMHPGNTINESAAKVSSEARTLFDRLTNDFPHLAQRPYFGISLEQNVTLSP